MFGESKRGRPRGRAKQHGEVPLPLGSDKNRFSYGNRETENATVALKMSYASCRPFSYCRVRINAAG